MRRKMETLIVIMVSILLIITVLILFQLFKIRKQQQLELLYLKEEMEQLMIKEFTSGTEKYGSTGRSAPHSECTRRLIRQTRLQARDRQLREETVYPFRMAGQTPVSPLRWGE